MQTQPHGFAYRTSKRALDVTGAFTALLIFGIPMLIIAVLIKLTSKGPALFKQVRPGLNGKMFTCYKFRTMVTDAEDILKADAILRESFEKNFKLEKDPRITAVGKWLRKLSLDELPQLINILNGTMSMIGPRPILLTQMESYGHHLPKLLSVKPGLGGYWQCYGRSSTTLVERIKHDLHYVDNRSFLLDMRLIVLTVISVIKREGAY